MIENLDRYRDLSIRLKEERKILEELESTSNSIRNEFNDNKIEIYNLNKENEELNHKIKQIINRKMVVANIFLKLFSIIFIVISTVAIATLSNLNIVIMFVSSACLPLLCIYVSHTITKLLEKSYRKRNKKIIAMDTLISDNQKKIGKCNVNNEKLLEDIIKTAGMYDKQKYKVRIIENLVNEMKLDYASPIFEEELKSLDNSDHLTRVRKTREN